MSSHKVTIESGKEILREIRANIYYLSKTKYPNLTKYIGKQSTLREELITLLTFLLNAHNTKNEGGVIEQRFFTAYHQYCFYMDSDSYTEKIRKKDKKYISNRERSNHALNIFCALGLFNKDKYPDRYGINLNMKLNTGRKRDLTIYHFNRIRLEKLEENAERLNKAKITVSTISAVNLRAAGLNDIADRVYFKNKELAYDKKHNELIIVFDILKELITDKGYCTKGELIARTPLPENEVIKVIKAFKADIEYTYKYGAANKEERQRYNYHSTKWIYRKRA